jgi:hypothetical protein
MLSQVLPVWKQLYRHFLAWHSKLNDDQLKADNVPDVLRQRKEKSVPDAALAAFVLDPLNFHKDEQGQWRAPTTLLTTSEKAAVKKLLERMLGADKAVRVLDEWSSFKLSPFTDELAEDLTFITSTVRLCCCLALPHPVQGDFGVLTQHGAWPHARSGISWPALPATAFAPVTIAQPMVAVLLVDSSILLGVRLPISNTYWHSWHV